MNRKTNLLRRSLKIPLIIPSRISKNKSLESNTSNATKIYNKTLELARRKCIADKIEQKIFINVLRKLFEGFSSKQLYFISLFFPHWYVCILLDKNRKITFYNLKKYKEKLIYIARKLSGSTVCEEWNVLCNTDCSNTCDIYQSDVFATASIKSKLKEK